MTARLSITLASIPALLLLWVTLVSLTLLSAFVPVAAFAKSHSWSHGSGSHDPDRIGWAIVTGDRNNSSNLDPEELSEMQSTVGGKFLYIHDGDDRYVILDRGLIARAERAMEPMHEAGREIREAVRAQVGYSVRYAGEQGRLAGRIGMLSGKIARCSVRGEDTEALEQERDELQHELDRMQERQEAEHDDAREAELSRATERASRHMEEATKKLDRELRDILREAKERHLAERSIED